MNQQNSPIPEYLLAQQMQAQSGRPSDAQVGGRHYKDMPIQPAYFCHVNKLGSLESNVVKYTCRHNKKNGKADIFKAMHYLLLLLEWSYGPETVAEVKKELFP